jgi:hypothetical protein
MSLKQQHERGLASACQSDQSFVRFFRHVPYYPITGQAIKDTGMTAFFNPGLK